MYSIARPVSTLDVLESINPASRSDIERLMPVGEDPNGDLLGVPWGSPVDALFELLTGQPGTGKTTGLVARAAALANYRQGTGLHSRHVGGNVGYKEASGFSPRGTCRGNGFSIPAFRRVRLESPGPDRRFSC